jgi:osmotically-inducible protein OsmY
MRIFIVAVALALAACASDKQPETKRTTGEFTSDAALTAKVKNIETYRGVVQLTGFVGSREQAQRAEAAAKKVEGVRSVKNDVRIKSDT